MKLDHRLGKRQSKPGTLMFAVVSRARAVKRLDHQRNFLGPHADTSVADANSQPRIVELTGDGYPAAGGGELDRIADEVDKYLLEFDRIGFQYRPSRWRSLDEELDLGRLGHRTQHCKALAEQGARLGGDLLDFELSCFDLRKIEHFFDQG